MAVGIKTNPARIPRRRVPHFEVYEDLAGEWRWRLVSNGRTVADSGEGYDTKSNVLRALRTLKGYAVKGRIQTAVVRVVEA